MPSRILTRSHHSGHHHTEVLPAQHVRRVDDATPPPPTTRGSLRSSELAAGAGGERFAAPGSLCDSLPGDADGEDSRACASGESTVKNSPEEPFDVARCALCPWEPGAVAVTARARALGDGGPAIAQAPSAERARPGMRVRGAGEGVRSSESWRSSESCR